MIYFLTDDASRLIGGLECQLSDSSTKQEEAAETAFDELLLQSSSRQENQTELPPHFYPAAVAGPQKPVLELGAALTMLSKSAAQRLVRILWDAIRRGESSIEIKLSPSQLGELVLRINVQGNQVNVEAQVQETGVAQLLLSNQQELRNGLARWGLVLGRFQAHSPNVEETLLRPIDAGEPMLGSLSVQKIRRSFIKVVI